MSLDELRERIKNELVLHEGNIADWQWNRTGLPAEARDLGIADFLRLVDDVARPLNAQFSKILELQAVIRKVATDTNKKLSDVQIGGFALEAERFGLSRAFVTEQWVPRIVAQLPDTPTVPATTDVPAAKPNNVPTGTPPPTASAQVTPQPNRQTALAPKVRDILDDYKEHIPAQAIRALFRAIDADENVLADVVLTYLRDNFYASVNEPTGPTLRDKLTSTDWRHLVWWDRSAQSQPTTPQEPVRTSPVPPPGQPMATQAPATPVRSESTGLRDMLFALLIAGGLIGFVIFLIKSGGTSNTAATTEQVRPDTSPERTQPDESEQPRRTRKKRRTRPDVTQAETRTADEANTDPAPPSPREEPYDLLMNDVGQYGERPARKDGQWGLWRKGRWLVLPVYDEIEVYRDGRARVSTNGNTYYIDRSGDRIRK